ncbi:MAG: ABC transporter ATP-binding protein [Variovorax sp.]|nr:MAG: ABC transporter ATP-binding protein [Variovorax sp.]
MDAVVTPPPAAVEVIALTKRYAAGTPAAVDQIDLRIASGSYCCLLGPSGCGKSTTLRMIAGHESVSSGDILLDNRNITDLPAAARGTAMMFQSFALFPHEPRVLLLDEPLSALDPFLRIQMRAELRRWQKELGLTFIHVTHSQEEAMALADTMVVMNHGLIEQVGSPHQVYNHPSSEFVARFMGGHNVLDTPAGAIAVRNDHMQIAPDTGGAGVPAHVTDVEYQGTYVLLGLALDGVAKERQTVSVLLGEAAFLARPYASGDAVRLSWAEADARVLGPGAQRPADRAAPPPVARDDTAAIAAFVA